MLSILPARNSVFEMFGPRGPETVSLLKLGGIGDLMCAVPAFRALRRAWPRAHIALIGLPWAIEFVERFTHLVDEFIEFPGHPAISSRPTHFESLPGFLKDMQSRNFDVSIHFQGETAAVNNILALTNPALLAGYFRHGEWCPNPRSFLCYPEATSEVLRHLELVRFLGLPLSDDSLEFPLQESESAALNELDEQWAVEEIYGSVILTGEEERRICT